MTTPPLRVVQWATGNIGTRSLSAVIDHPHLVLAGVFVTSAAKAGRDAGDLCGRPSTGVVAVDDVEQILALRADCVLYMPARCDFDQVAALLRAGCNVVTTRGEFHHPASMQPDDRAKIEAACAAGNASLHSTGSSPGFITEAAPFLLASIQRRIDRIGIDEFANMSQRDSPDLLFNVMGFGRAPSGHDQLRADHLAGAFGPSLRTFADGIGLPLDAVTATGATAVASRRAEIAAGVIEAGTVAAQQTTVRGMRANRALVEFRATWYCSTEIEADWYLGPTGWRLTVEGDAPLVADITFTTPLEQMAPVTPGYTAHRAVNAVPYVCAARPGIVTSVELPQIIPAFGPDQPRA